MFEIGWPVGLKMAQMPGRIGPGIAIAVVCMILSGWLLFLAQKTIPIGTAYAVWTGIGAGGTFLVGIFAYGDQASWVRFLAIVLILGGVALLKLTH